MRPVLALLAMAIAVVGATAQVQPKSSPVPIKGPFGGPKLQMPIELRPGNPAHRPGHEDVQLEDYRRWLEGMGKNPPLDQIDPKLLKDLVEKLNKQKVDNPEQIHRMVDQNPQFKDAEFLKQLGKMVESKDFVQNLHDKFPKNQTPPKIDNGAEMAEKFKEVIKSGQKPFDPGTLPKNPNLPKEVGGGELPKIDGAGNAKPPVGDNEWVKWLDKNFKDSPAAHNAAKDLLSALDKQGGKGMFDDVPEFKNGAWKDFNNWGKSNTGDLWKSKPPDMGGTKFTPPKIGGGGGGGGTWSGGGSGGSGIGGGGSGVSFDGGGTALAVIAGIVALIFLAILLLRKWKQAHVESAGALAAMKAGIDFEAIRSREELVRVFNSVSLERCGDDARVWNHRVIADQFGHAQPAHVEPADAVAGLYERARYAPLDEDLTDGEFADARRDLRVIAGVPA